MHYSLLLVVLFVAGAYAATSGRTDDCCSHEDKKEIEWIWHRVWQSANSERKVRVMSAVVHDIIEHHPEYKDQMAAKGVTDDKSPTARAYMIRLVHQFDNVINLLEEPLILQAQLEFMKEAYGAKPGVKKTYFDAIVESLERVLPQVASCFPTAAWNRCLERLAHALTEDLDE